MEIWIIRMLLAILTVIPAIGFGAVLVKLFKQRNDALEYILLSCATIIDLFLFFIGIIAIIYVEV